MYMRILILLLFSLLIGCKDSSIQSHYTDENVAIDGKLDEWNRFPLHHFEDENFSISFQNNENELFIVLATRDRHLMRIVQTSGIDIWLDIDKKKSKEYGLHYIGNIDTLDFSQMKNMPQRDFEPKDKEETKHPRQKPGTILFSKFGNEYLIEKFKTTDPMASVDMYKSVYLVEFRILFSSDNIFANLKENDIKKINVGLALGMDMSEMKKQMKESRPSGGRGGGMGGRGGGKIGGAPPGDRPQPISKIEKWFTVALEHK